MVLTSKNTFLSLFRLISGTVEPIVTGFSLAADDIISNLGYFY